MEGIKIGAFFIACNHTKEKRPMIGAEQPEAAGENKKYLRPKQHSNTRVCSDYFVSDSPSALLMRTIQTGLL